MQATVNERYEQFVDFVAKGRRVTRAKVRTGFGEGRALSAARAVQEGLADRVASLDEVLDGLAGTAGGRRTDADRRAAWAALRRRYG